MIGRGWTDLPLLGYRLTIAGVWTCHCRGVDLPLTACGLTTAGVQTDLPLPDRLTIARAQTYHCQGVDLPLPGCGLTISRVWVCVDKTSVEYLMGETLH